MKLFDFINVFRKNTIQIRCPRCNTRLEKSHIEGYTYYCRNCDEDFYNIEVDTDIAQNNIVVKCYGKETKFKNHKQALDFYMQAMMCSEGSEQCRYSNIVAQLYEGKMYCSDEFL